MTPLPTGWRWATLGEIADVVGGVTKDSKLQSRPDLVEVPYLRVANVQRGRIDLSNVATIRVPPQKAAQLELQPGDVLLNEGGDRDKLGRGWVWQGQIPGCIHQNHVFRARIRDGSLHPKLLAWYANEVAHKWFELNGKQSVNLASISLSKIRTFPVPVPPVEEQWRIVDILEDHLSRLDNAQYLMSTVGKRLEAYEAAALSRCRTGNEHLLTEVASIQGGIQKHGKRAPKNNAYPFLRVANVTKSGLDLNEVHRIELFDGELARLRLQVGDLLVVEGNGSPSQIGRAAVWDGSISDCVHQNHLIRVRPKDGLNPHYLSAVWNSPENRQKLRLLASSSSGLHTLSVSKLKTLRIPVPSVAEQKAAVETLSLVQENRQRLQDRVHKSRTRSERLRRALLDVAFSGRLTGRASDMDMVEEMAGV